MCTPIREHMFSNEVFIIVYNSLALIYVYSCYKSIIAYYTHCTVENINSLYLYFDK
jgi:hypothetical protein